jgi:hypothetical protein
VDAFETACLNGARPLRRSETIPSSARGFRLSMNFIPSHRTSVWISVPSRSTQSGTRLSGEDLSINESQGRTITRHNQRSLRFARQVWAIHQVSQPLRAHEKNALLPPALECEVPVARRDPHQCEERANSAAWTRHANGSACKPTNGSEADITLVPCKAAEMPKNFRTLALQSSLRR